MPFELVKTPDAKRQYHELEVAAKTAETKRKKKGKKKSSKQEGLFKQVHKCLKLLGENPRHPSLHTHEFDSLDHPYAKSGKVFVAYAQNKRSDAYRIFWCYGPDKGKLTIIAITQHP